MHTDHKIAEAPQQSVSNAAKHETRNAQAPARHFDSTVGTETLRIDSEFRALIPPLTPDERKLLEESIVQEGCRDPLVVWDGILVDGHNRYEICTRHGITFKVVERTFSDRGKACSWIIRNQLARRNLTPEQRTYLIGKQYIFKREAFRRYQQQKHEWIKRARSEFRPGPQHPCRICGRYSSVTQAHHIVPLHKQDIHNVPDQRFVWLCPTHHAGVHQLLGRESGFPEWEGFTEEEKSAMTGIAALSFEMPEHELGAEW